MYDVWKKIQQVGNRKKAINLYPNDYVCTEKKRNSSKIAERFAKQVNLSMFLKPILVKKDLNWTSYKSF